MTAERADELHRQFQRRACGTGGVNLGEVLVSYDEIASAFKELAGIKSRIATRRKDLQRSISLKSGHFLTSHRNLMTDLDRIENGETKWERTHK